VRDQRGWRRDQILAAGEEVELELDLATTGDTSAGRICRSVALSTADPVASDRCSIGGFIDRRDGWPIAIGISRSAEGAGGREAQTRIFYRVAPAEGFAAPPNLCSAAADRG
jgi:hypothetical protein